MDPVTMINELIKKSGGYRCIDYVFEIWYKYSHERDYTVSYELCEFDFDENLTWENDWWEGQQEVMFKRVVALEDILDYYFENHKKCEEEEMVKHGKWVEESRKADGIFDLYQTFIICSICGNEHYYGTGDKPNFCDKCGAKMDLRNEVRSWSDTQTIF